MRKIFVIALREYNAAVRTKAFVISLVIMPLMMGGSILVQWLLKDYRDTKDKTFAVIYSSAGKRYYETVQNAVQAYNDQQATGDTQAQARFKVEPMPAPAAPKQLDDLRAELSERVRKGELVGFLEIGPDIVLVPKEEDERRSLRYQTNRPTHREFPRLAKAAITAEVHKERSERAKLDANKVLEIVAAVPVVEKGLSRRNAEGVVEDATEQGRFAPMVVPGVLMILMYMMIMLGSTPLMQGVVEEKMQRIAEVLLGSVQPFPLMLGKIIGMTGVSLTIAAVYLGGAYWAAHRYGLSEYVPVNLLLWFVVFQTLASLMYGSLFIAVGAACTDMKETQNLLWPIMLLATLPMFVLRIVLQEPNSTVATAMSFFPFATPMLMIARQAVPPGIAWWQPALGAVGVLATTLVCVYAAGRIFRVGLLMQGKGARLGEMVRWVFRG
jgi:ABC-2 type transport system permease protein